MDIFEQHFAPRLRAMYRDGRHRLTPEALKVAAERGWRRFTEFRKDGWPLCPACGEEELWSGLMMRWDGEGERPTLDECLAQDFGCYACGWNSEAK